VVEEISPSFSPRDAVLDDRYRARFVGSDAPQVSPPVNQTAVNARVRAGGHEGILGQVGCPNWEEQTVRLCRKRQREGDENGGE
jgi:hypothetical protein